MLNLPVAYYRGKEVCAAQMAHSMLRELCACENTPRLSGICGCRPDSAYCSTLGICPSTMWHRRKPVWLRNRTLVPNLKNHFFVLISRICFALHHDDGMLCHLLARAFHRTQG